MEIKKLKEYGVQFNELKKAVIGLNEASIVDSVPVKGKGEELLFNFVDAIKRVPDTALEDIPEPVGTFYDTLPDNLFDDIDGIEQGAAEKAEADSEPAAEAAAPEATAGKITSKCPVFMTGWNPEEDDCKDCAENFTNEHDACKVAVEAKTTAKTEKQEKQTTAKKNAGKRSRYGHMVDSMAARIDDLVYQGGLRTDIIQTIMDEHTREEKQATSKVNSHIAHLIKNKGIEITDKDGKVKAKKKYAEGRDKNNTVSTLE